MMNLCLILSLLGITFFVLVQPYFMISYKALCNKCTTRGHSDKLLVMLKLNIKSSSVLRLIYRPPKSIKTANTVCIHLFFLFEYRSFSWKALIIFKFLKTQSTKENSNQAHETNKKPYLKKLTWIGWTKTD